jgi:chromosomal replication initiation ATPase DnaA
MKGETAAPSRQLPLGLRHTPAMTRADFLTGEANRAAIALIDRWPDWPAPVVVIAGPAGSGKSHLAAIWREASGAATTAAAAVADGGLEALVATGAVVEDLHAGPLDEAALFHLINLARERQAPLLFTSRVPLGALPLGLPDLVSRLRAAHVAVLGPPEDEFLRRLLVKLFADRQLAVDPQVIDYITVRMERSVAAAEAIVDLLDRAALAAGKGITRPLAAAALGLGGENSGNADEI